MSPADPIASLLSIDGFEDDVMSDDQYNSQYKRMAGELGLDLPKFYFSIVPRYYPDTLHKIIDKTEKKQVIALLAHHNDWEAVSSFINQGKFLLGELEDTESRLLIGDLLNDRRSKAHDMDILSSMEGQEREDITAFIDKAKNIRQVKKSNFAIPKFLWFGFNNQFHSWMSKFFTGSLGRSIQDGRSVWSKISKALVWTLFLVVVGLFVAVLISVPLGVWSASNVESRMSKFCTNFFYFIYAMPLFWFATLMVVFFTTSQYGNWTNIFPGVGISPYSSGLSIWSKIIANSKQLILPVFCMVLHSVAYLSSIVRNSVIAESKQAYKTTALLKGLTKGATFWRHLFPNSVLPLVTIIIGIIPASLAGSLVIEVIFNIPGIGRLIYDSIFGNDWYVIFSIVMLVGVVTIISYLIGDLLYSFLNPKIRFGNNPKG